MNWLTNIFSGGAAAVVDKAGKGIGNVLDRFGFTKKQSDQEKFENYLKICQTQLESDKVDIQDMRSARELYMIQMQQQPASWLVRQLNGALRPAAGWWALLCITDKWWSQMLGNLIDGFMWIPIEATPLEQSVIAGILAFFFGFRQRSKEKNVTLKN